jgi:hypothetical protein
MPCFRYSLFLFFCHTELVEVQKNKKELKQNYAAPQKPDNFLYKYKIVKNNLNLYNYDTKTKSARQRF